MSRTVSQTLLDALANQQGETILRVKTWADLAAYNAAPTVPEATWETNKFEIGATEASASLVSPTNAYIDSDFTVFLIERGISLASVEYVVQSGLYFVTEFKETDGRIQLKGSSYPDAKIVMDGDDTYENVITAFCTEIGKTAVFKDSGAAWLSYQFLPAGKQIVLNKAEKFENLIQQKYLIKCYERSPKELVFYHAATEQSAWKDIIYNDSKLVLSASSGSREAAYSADGLGFIKVDAPHFCNAIAYSPTLDLFAAVGNGVAMSSPDGVTWTTRTIGTGDWTGVAWDATIAKFVAIRIGATATSSNGTAWTVSYNATYINSWVTRNATEANSWMSLCWSPELSLFVAISEDGTNRVMTSPDGTTWTARNAAEANTWTSVCWSPELTLFVAVASYGTNQVMTSPDGITWTARGAAESAQWHSVCWSPALVLFVAVNGNGTNKVMTSPDGISWTARTGINSNWQSICWSPELSLFVAVATTGVNQVMTSPDGTTWTARSATEANSWTSVCWSPQASIFVAISSNGTNRVMTSPDGTTWTARSAAEANSWRSIVWSKELSTLVAVSSDGTNRVMTNNIGKSFLSIASNGAGTLAAVGVDSAYTSTDGSSWTTRTIPAGTYHKIIYANSLFVAVGASKCATSPDGITWTERTIPAGTYTALTYSPTLDLFLAMGDNLAATSPDGITWTSRTPPADLAWTAVTWADSLAKFFAVASEGDNRIASSADGLTWEILSAQADFSLTYLDGPKSEIIHGTKTVYFLSRDETGATNTEGDTNNPAWNLGYLESTDSAPQTNSDPFYKFYIQKAPLRLDLTDGDRGHFEPNWTLDPAYPIDAMVTIIENFDANKSPAWYQDIRSLAIFDGVEGGSLPSTIERVSAYTPLNSSGFDGNLTPDVNNLQALAEAVDDLNIASGPVTTAVNDFQVGDGLGAWVKKTLAQTITILRTSLDSVYAALTHTHAASDITSGTMATARLGSGTANSTTYLRGDQTWETPEGGSSDISEYTIAVSVASNNITVALKDKDGNDPSSETPVKIKIGNTIRTITSAVSVTKNAGTSWCSAGDSRFATKEIDYFVYLIWNTTPATDVIDIGFARIPYCKNYSEFSGTSTNEKYLAYGNASAPTSTDDLVVIGRFAATLSAGGSYNWSVPTFTSINLIQHPIYITRILSWVPAYSANSSMTYTSVTTDMAEYVIRDREIFVELEHHGTIGGTVSHSVIASAPFGARNVNPAFAGWVNTTGSSAIGGYCLYASGSIYFRRYDFGNWSAGSGRYGAVSGSYFI